MDRKQKIELTREVLKFIGLAGTVATAVLFPGMAKVIGPMTRERKRLHVGVVNLALKRLESRGLLAVKIHNGNKFVSLTPPGIQLMYKMELRKCSIKKPKRWDEQWRIVIFDVLEKERRLRDRMREVLRGLGFKQLQQSVWIHPYSCEEAIELMRNAYDLRRAVIYFTSPRFAGDYPLLRSFGLHHDRE